MIAAITLPLLLLAPPDEAEFDKIVRAYADLNRFAGAAQVVRDGKVILSKGYGLASEEFGVPNTADTRYDIGSVSKQFTAAAILKLEAQGKLSTSDAVSKHLPDYPKEQGAKVSLHHLLTHTSGIPSLGRRDGLPEINEDGNPRTLDQLIDYSKDKPLQFEPGSTFRYNNSAYVLLVKIIEKVSGEPFRTYMQREILDKAGLKDTGFIEAGKVVKNMARGYMGYHPNYVHPPYTHPDWRVGGGGMYSTVGDLNRWLLHIDTVLPAPQLDKFTKMHLSPDATKTGYGYGYGWFFYDISEIPVMNHGGTVEGFVAALYWVPSQKLAVAVLANHVPALGVDVPDRIGSRIIAANGGKPYGIPPTPVRQRETELKRLEGQYDFGSGYVLEVKVEGVQLYATAKEPLSWSLATVGTQKALDHNDPLVRRGMAALEAILKGDHPTLSKIVAPERLSYYTTENTKNRAETMARQWGKVLRMTAIDSIPDGQGRIVPARIQFERKELYLHAEFNSKGEMVGLYYSDTLPSRTPLVPIGGDKFFVDGFAYGVPDVTLTLRATELVIEGKTPLTARKLP